jgi:hypothetical protein
MKTTTPLDKLKCDIFLTIIMKLSTETIDKLYKVKLYPYMYTRSQAVSLLWLTVIFWYSWSLSFSLLQHKWFRILDAMLRT